MHAYAAWVERHAPQRRRTAQLCLEALERGLATTASLLPSEAPLCFCRSDPRFANVLTRPDGRLGLVDWEDSGLRDPAREVADLLLHPNQEDLLDAHGWKAFLAPYLASRGGDPGFQDRLRGYLGHLPRFLAWPPARRRPGSRGAWCARGVAGQRARAE